MLKGYGSNPAPVYKTVEEEQPFDHCLVIVLMEDGTEIKASHLKGVFYVKSEPIKHKIIKWKYRYELWK